MASVNRYSTVVSWVKVVLPIIALGLLSSLFLFSRTPDPDAALPFADVDVAQLARERRLSQPRFAGTLEDGREVTLVAETAAPTARDPNVIVLDQVEARVELSSSDALRLNSNAGRIDMVAQIADLTGDVRLVTVAGYQIDSQEMIVSMRDLRVVSPGEVVAQGPTFSLNAGAMILSGPENEAILRFTGGVRLVYEARRVEEAPQ